jgi:hypothetical protein
MPCVDLSLKTIPVVDPVAARCALEDISKYGMADQQGCVYSRIADTKVI